MFAGRTGWELRESPLEAAAERRRRDGLALLDLAESNPTRLGLGAPGAALARALHELAGDPCCARYAPDPRGDRRAREAIAALHAAHGAALAPEHLVLTAGTSEGYAHLFRLLADPGDRVHLPRPGYGLFEQLAELEGLEVVPYHLEAPRHGARWRVDLDGLAATLAPTSRAVLVIHPHNPTGSLLDEADLRSLRALARERDLALLCDEVFAESLGPGPAFRSTLAGAGDGPLHFLLSGASKLLGLPQLKVAWIGVSGPGAARDAALARLEVIADAYLSVSPLLAALLARLLPERAALGAPLQARLAANRARLAALPASGALRALPVEAGWAAILRVPSREADDEAWACRLLDATGVQVQPGQRFDLPPRPGEAQLVVSLLPEPADFARALDALAGFAATLA